MSGGYRAESRSLGAQSSAFGAELAALVRAIEICALDASDGQVFRILTDSQAAMRRLQGDQPGPGQGLARRGIQVARQRIYGRGASVNIMWIPGHSGIPGNELADCCAGEEAERTEALRKARKDKADERDCGRAQSASLSSRARQGKERTRDGEGRLLDSTEQGDTELSQCHLRAGFRRYQ